MDLLKTWSTDIVKTNLSDRVNLQEIMIEILSTLEPDFSGKSKSDESQVITADKTPYAFKVQNEVLRPLVMEYIRTHLTDDLLESDVSSSTFVRYHQQGHGMNVHNHAGAHVSAILYVEASAGDVIFTDPRQHAARGYPHRIHSNKFSTLRLTPKTGDFIIFPSYVFHHTGASPDAMRIALPTDYYIKQDHER